MGCDVDWRIMNASSKTADFFDLKAPKAFTGNSVSTLNVETDTGGEVEGGRASQCLTAQQ